MANHRTAAIRDRRPPPIDRPHGIRSALFLDRVKVFQPGGPSPLVTHGTSVVYRTRSCEIPYVWAIYTLLKSWGISVCDGSAGRSRCHYRQLAQKGPLCVANTAAPSTVRRNRRPPLWVIVRRLVSSPSPRQLRLAVRSITLCDHVVLIRAVATDNPPFCDGHHSPCPPRL